jgi:hypothetical protein
MIVTRPFVYLLVCTVLYNVLRLVWMLKAHYLQHESFIQINLLVNLQDTCIDYASRES